MSETSSTQRMAPALGELHGQIFGRVFDRVFNVIFRMTGNLLISRKPWLNRFKWWLPIQAIVWFGMLREARRLGQLAYEEEEFQYLCLLLELGEEDPDTLVSGLFHTHTDLFRGQRFGDAPAALEEATCRFQAYRDYFYDQWHQRLRSRVAHGWDHVPWQNLTPYFYFHGSIEAQKQIARRRGK